MVKNLRKFSRKGIVKSKNIVYTKCSKQARKILTKTKEGKKKNVCNR